MFTRVKNEYFVDIIIQKFIFDKSGFNVFQIYKIFLNFRKIYRVKLE